MNRWTRDGRPEIDYAWRTVSVEHLEELQEDIDSLRRQGKLSSNEIYQGYLSNKKFAVPEDFPGAKFIVPLAVFTRLMHVRFHHHGEAREIMVPPQYYDDGLSLEDLHDVLQQDVLKQPGYRVERATHLHLKLLAVRSGLAQYGRNNLAYVEGMGTFLTLYAFFTDYPFETDDWHEISMMELCGECRRCMKQCPNNCITEDNSIIDVGRCVTLYNEIEGDFPGWMSGDSHSALMGCVKCQLGCPANRESAERAGRLRDVTDEETRGILEGRTDKALLEALSAKLGMFSPQDGEAFLPILSRNLRVLIGKS